MKHRSVRMFVVALTVVLGTSTLALAQSGSADPQDDQELVLRVGTDVELNTDNPWAVEAGSDWSVVTTQYDMLLKFDSEDLSPAPSLATGCEPNTDSTEWTCTLREGLKWSDGSPLTSSDVAFSYRFVIDHQIPQYRSYFAKGTTFETPDERTLVWKSLEPTFALDMPPWAYVVPQSVWEPLEDAELREIREAPNTPSIGSGPFTLTEWNRGRGWTMERNPYYWGPEPAVDRIEYTLYTNQEAMIQALRNGEIDVADGISPQLIDSAEGLDDVEVQQVVSDWWLNLAFNFGGQGPEAHPLPALHDHAVREAIAMAIDKEAIVEKVYRGVATTGDTIIRPASAFWHLDIPAEEELPFDIPGANALLDDAGYADTDGDEVREDPATGEPLEMLIPASDDTTGAVGAGELIVGYLKQIGIDVTLQPVSDAKLGDYWGAGNFDAYIWYWSGDPDPNYQLFVFTSDQCGAWSDGCWKDPDFDALYEEQGKTLDRNERQQLVFEAQQLAYDEIPSVVLAYPGWLTAYRTDRVTGWVPAPGADGYLLPAYNYDSLVALRAVSAEAAADTGSVGVPGWIWLVGIAVIALAAVVIIRRGRGSEADEA
ncbi:MAG TPA: ABC transporter substrate-binding protein [Actinomycetota bacterium]